MHFLNKNVKISIKISLKFVPKGPINNIPALVQIMTWHRPGDKPLSEPMMVNLLTHICVTRPQWVNSNELSIDMFLQWNEIHMLIWYGMLWWLWCQKQVSQAWISNCIPQYFVGCNYLIHAWDTCSWHPSPHIRWLSGTFCRMYA